MFTALCSASTMPVKSAAVSATTRERMPMTSISRATSQRYEGGSARLRATWAARSASPPYQASVSRVWSVDELDRGHCARPGREALDEGRKSRPPGLELLRRRDVQEVVDAAVALDDQRLHLDLPARRPPLAAPGARPGARPPISGIALHGHRRVSPKMRWRASTGSGRSRGPRPRTSRRRACRPAGCRAGARGPRRRRASTRHPSSGSRRE